MRVGCDLPYFDDPAKIRDFVQAVESLGYHHIGFSEHVASGRGTAYPPNFRSDDPWHESFTQAAFVAAVTNRIEINPAMVLLTLRHPVLAAKQIAELGLLSGGRTRIAASIGWNHEELRALGIDPITRAARFEEQITVMRSLWTNDVVDHHGDHFTLDGVSLHPRPSRPISVWMGAGSFATGGRPTAKPIERMARLADGYKMFAPLCFDLDAGASAIDEVHAALQRAGRDRSTFGIEARIAPQLIDENEWIPRMEHWRNCGVSHIGLSNRLGAGSVDAELARLERFRDLTRHLWS